MTIGGDTPKANGTEPGDVGCGTDAVTDILERDRDSGLGGAGFGLGKIWDAIQGVFAPFINLISFQHAWLSGDDLPEVAAWMIAAGQTILGVTHVYVVFSTMKSVLGRN